MKTDLSLEDRKRLQQILEKSRFFEEELQKNPSDRKPQFSTLLKEFVQLFTKLDDSNDPLVKRQSQLADHFHEEMTHRHFLNFLIPLERLIDRSLTDPDFFVTTSDQKTSLLPRRPLTLVLDNLRSAFNVGAIFRTAETLRAENIFLCGYTPGPESVQVQKTAMGTENLVPAQHFENVGLAINNLKQLGIRTIALETSPQALSLYEKPLPAACAFVLGNERFGLDLETLRLCDEVRSIPLVGSKNSLNVASTLAIASFEWHRQHPELS